MTEDSFLYAQSLHRCIQSLNDSIDKINKFLVNTPSDNKKAFIELYDKKNDEYPANSIRLTGQSSIEIAKLMRSKFQHELTVLQEEFNNL